MNFGKFLEGMTRIAEKMRHYAVSHSCTTTLSSPFAEGRWSRGDVQGKIQGSDEEFKVGSQRSDCCEMDGKFLPQKGDDTNASGESTSSGGTSRKSRTDHYPTKLPMKAA